MGTTSEKIPSTSTMSPTQNNAFMLASLVQLAAIGPHCSSSLRCRVFLSSGSDAGQDSQSQQYHCANHNPTRRDVQERCPINQAADHDQKPHQVDAERHGASFPRSANLALRFATPRAVR